MMKPILLIKDGKTTEAGAIKAENATISPGAFVFCERISGTMRFQVDASPDGSLPLDQAAGLLAMHCLVRGQVPADYTVLVAPRKSLLDPVEVRSKQLLDSWHEFRSDVKLSPREQNVLECLLGYLSNKEIGQQLNISERTVKFHVSALFAKFNVRDRFSLIRQATVGLLRTAAAPVDTLFSCPALGK